MRMTIIVTNDHHWKAVDVTITRCDKASFASFYTNLLITLPHTRSNGILLDPIWVKQDRIVNYWDNTMILALIAVARLYRILLETLCLINATHCRNNLFTNVEKIYFFYVVPSYEETLFQLPSIVCISAIIHFTHYVQSNNLVAYNKLREWYLGWWDLSPCERSQ